MRTFFLSLPLLLLLLLTSCQTPTSTTKKCGDEVLAAFDVGSGSTKMKIAKYNSCTNTIPETIYIDQVKVDYRDSLEKNDAGEFSKEIKSEGKAALKKLKITAVEKGATKFAGVATAAFRQAKNAESFIQEIKKELGIQIRIIPQSEEALLGFKAAALSVNKNPDAVTVWDIGGGSMQITALKSATEPEIYYGQLASVSFKNKVIETIQKKDINTVTSPNPMSAAQVNKALLLAEDHATLYIPAFLKKRMPQTEVLGIGGVLSRSITKYVPNKSPITLQDIKAAIKTATQKTDSEIGGDFAATELTNLILVAGHMKALKIKAYIPTEAALVDAIWTDPSYWN